VYIEAKTPYLTYVLFRSVSDSKDFFNRGTPKIDKKTVLITDEIAALMPARIKISKNKNASAPIKSDAAVDLRKILASFMNLVFTNLYSSSSDSGAGGIYLSFDLL